MTAGAVALVVLVALAIFSWAPPGSLAPQNLGVAQAAPEADVTQPAVAPAEPQTDEFASTEALVP
jgi:hypothetical protein